MGRLSIKAYLIVLLVFAVFAGSDRASAQTSTDTQAAPASPSGNAQQPQVQPAKGQSPQVEQKDISECYEIAKMRTGIDPKALGLSGKLPGLAPGGAGAAGANTTDAARQIANAPGAQGTIGQATAAAGAAAGSTEPSAEQKTNSSAPGPTGGNKASNAAGKLNTFKMADQACFGQDYYKYVKSTSLMSRE
jgi:hypothetical protein